MRFDPQSNIISAEDAALAPAPAAPVAPAAAAARTGPRTMPVSVVLTTAVLVIGGLMWFMVGPGKNTSFAGFTLPKPIGVTAVSRDESSRVEAVRPRSTASVPRRAPASTPATVAQEEVSRNMLVGSSRVHYFRGRKYLKEGRVNEAVTELTEAVRLAPGDADAHYKLGLAYVGLRDGAAARQELALLQKLDPNLASLLGNLVR